MTWYKHDGDELAGFNLHGTPSEDGFRDAAAAP
jgi:hypothetical protein